MQVKFNPEHWYFKHCKPEDVAALMEEEATITGYLPSFRIVTWKLSGHDSAGMKVWNMGGRTNSHTHLSDSLSQMPFLVDPVAVEQLFLPIISNVGDLNPDDIKTGKHFWDTYGKSETESYMRWLIIECQKQGHFNSGIESEGATSDLCLEGLLTDLGGGKFLPTRLAIRKLAGAGFWKPLADL